MNAAGRETLRDEEGPYVLVSSEEPVRGLQGRTSRTRSGTDCISAGSRTSSESCMTPSRPPMAPRVR